MQEMNVKNIVSVNAIVGDAGLIAKMTVNGMQLLTAQNWNLMSWEKVASL